MSREELIRTFATLYTGLQVPVSMSMPLGAADDAWRTINAGLGLVGWVNVEDVEAAMSKVFDNE